jgi:hypothetical protein
VSNYPETLLLKIIGELFVENRLMREELEIRAQLEREENENSIADFTDNEGASSNIGSETIDP